MATAPGHKFGQIIGDTLELAIRTSLEAIAQNYGLYLDYKHPRPARGNKSKVNWCDYKGNTHDLDYVLEEDGTEYKIGKPRAFIESAWRRYTKHSRNKTQEIQGAITPLAETYKKYHPFLGVVLAGVFTEGSLAQLRSHGFTVLYFSYKNIIEAFRTVGIDASFDEDTKDEELQKKIDAYEMLSETQIGEISNSLRHLREKDLNDFLDSLKNTLERKVEIIIVLPLHGTIQQLRTTQDAIQFLKDYNETQSHSEFIKYEVNIRYTNGDEIRGAFRDKGSAIEFLNTIS